MIRKLTLACAALFFSCSAINAQKCGFDHQHRKMLSNDPAYAARIAQDDIHWQQANQQIPNGLVVVSGTDTTYEIPVVIHVMHTGGAVGSIYNPSVTQLTGMIDYLNASYAATWGAYPAVGGGGTKVPFKFVLAKRTPNCTATTGILRYDLSGNAAYSANGINIDNTNGISDVTLKNFERWPVNDYYNIWVVNKIDGQDGVTGSGVYTAGFAYFPTAGASVDGTVMLASKSKAGEITLPHEVGHAMNLYHVFEGNDPTNAGQNNCPIENFCATENDRVCDTEPMQQSQFNCPSGTNPCTSLPWQNTQHNFMDYSDCQDRFTAGQRTRMIDALKTYRGSLLSSLGATDLPTTSAIAPVCNPTITNPLNNVNAGPRKVVLNDLTGSTLGGYNDDGNQVYLDRVCAQQANLNVGQAYTMTVTTGPNENLRVYIDYNNDGLFTGTNEQVVARAGSGAQAATFTVPTTGVVTCTPLRMRVVSDVIGAPLPTPCGALSNGQAEDYAVSIKGPSNAATVSIALTAGTNPSCINTSLTFTATPAGTPGAGATYRWYINGVAATAASTSTTFTTLTPVNGNVITARIFYTGPCGSDSSLSNTFLVQRVSNLVPAATIAITNGSNPGCNGQSLTFTASAVNGGTTPTYTWTRNGVAIPGATTGNVFTSTTLTSGDVIRAILTSSLSCATPVTATSNAITLTFATSLSATASIAQTSGVNPACGGKSNTFTLTTTNGGAAPVYAWLINGVTTGATGTTFTTSTLNDKDTVQALLISNSPCVTAPVVLSNQIIMTVLPSDTINVASTITAGGNPGCDDSLLQFTAISSAVGGTYTWFVNNTATATGTVFGNTGFATGDQVYVRLIGGPGCHVNDTAFSDVTNVVRNVTPIAPVISFIGNMLVSNQANVQWYGPSGIVAGATTQSYHPAGPGYYYARSLGNSGCPSLPSNLLQVSLLTIGDYNLDAVQIYPNPTSGNLTLDWGSTKVNVTVNIFTTTGQRVMQQEVKGTSRQTMDLSTLSAGIYFVTIRDEAGKTGTVRITVAK